MDINVEHTLTRRVAALLEMRVRALVRAGQPIAAAYVSNIPMSRVQWATRIKWA